FTPPKKDENIVERAKSYTGSLREAMNTREKHARYAAIHDVEERAVKELAVDFPGKEKDIAAAVAAAYTKMVRQILFDEASRIDGRKPTDIRAMACEVGLLPRTHGSGLFTRGETQALVTTTLGTAQDVQRIDSLLGDVTKRFMLHYNFPPFSTGEAKMMRSASRREIGHGHLAERALLRVLPTYEDFPYTIRIVSEILESNGSSSMASVYGGCLLL